MVDPKKFVRITRSLGYRPRWIAGPVWEIMHKRICRSEKTSGIHMASVGLSQTPSESSKSGWSSASAVDCESERNSGCSWPVEIRCGR